MSSRIRENYQPSKEPKRTYNGPAVPTAYDSGWQMFNNLTPDQIAWFQSQPEWRNFLAYVALSPSTAAVSTPVAVVNSVLSNAPLASVTALNINAKGPAK